ncbi:hypothetical protein [Desulfopila sp. IMCC35008]|uniref:hypothetical protein n=1 Tax=Desulfopila sp. IMCC35008 TaxID=2653858 RepID=UPI0013D395FB|nr:hypothetical protein [Desulfopila sp. IMCC35008]
MNHQPRRFSLFLCFLFCLLLLAGCASNRLVSSWSDPAAGTVQGDVLVVAVTHQDTVRRLFEDSYVTLLQGEGLTAVPGYTVTEGGKPVSYDDVIAAIGLTGSKALLVTRLSDVSVKTFEQLATGRKYDTLDVLEADPIFFNPVLKQSTTNTTRMKLVSWLYDVQSGKLLWSAVTESKDPVMTRDYINKLVRMIVADMKKKQLM